MVFSKEAADFFPDIDEADYRGFLISGGRLSPDWLLEAYSKGIFPWPTFRNHINWYSPEPRAVMRPQDVKVQKSMRSYFNQKKFDLKIDTAFEQVISNCANIKRKDEEGTWIFPEMQKVYTELHKLGYAHSFEAWKDDELVGGLYGISLGRMFFGESMFSYVSNASKFAFILMCRILEKNNFLLIDCQMPTEHLMSLGCGLMRRNDFKKLLVINNKLETLKGNWQKILK